MKNVLFILLAIVLFAPRGVANEVPEAAKSYGQIKLTISGFANKKGIAMIALHNTEKTYLKKAAPFRGAKLEIPGETLQYEFDGVPYGEYAVAVFHDENSNEDLDLGVFFIPKEPYGFSNNAKGKYGPPSYKQVAFKLEQESLELSIAVKKLR